MPLTIRERNTGRLIASGSQDDNSVLLLEGNWYFAPDAVDTTELIITDRTYTCPYKGVCKWIDLQGTDGVLKNVGFVYYDTRDDYGFIRDRIAFYSRSTAGTMAATEDDVSAQIQSR
jgi:uncharacterized protein (DUF427 family)